ncbi:LacI family DNA-binding transcriptional regulator [Streptomyces sp. NPDC090127]|uniref:LacI family DNA-binding transcriptional regulator n=1 Tax=Streptomyces sp. NPDC090127 TaxID=3365953 RepID=UPI00383030B4
MGVEDTTVASAVVREPAMTDVARLAGVSHQTVSRVLNSHPNVREQTRLRVLAAVKELGYRPNRAARALVTGRSQLIGVIAQNSTLYGPSSLLAAFEIAAALQGFAVSVHRVHELGRSSITAAVERHRDERVAGIVAIAPTASANEALAGVPAEVPLVTVDGDPEGGAPMVAVDQEEGAYQATRHLLEAGHETVWHISGPPDWFDAAGRIRGWRRALQEAGAEIPPISTGDWSAASGYRAGQMLARMPEVTAVFAANDHQALGTLRAMTERGRSVPEEVSIVGFDDVPEAPYYSPPLTTVRQDFGAVATATLQLLFRLMNEGETGGSQPVIQPELVLRESVRAPRRD